ncbi:hypothetical protein O9K51_08352 [Purpureocillium lavendulum]|uniref:Uncharacterized protein n=1 Tax=Purpureocillium lavendulum TaxID=1247861 RepID=A0AB34FJ36_9HYPO|nr:hypothetical protein O9K51_08352 [Purpureocillium lavendulum]
MTCGLAAGLIKIGLQESGTTATPVVQISKVTIFLLNSSYLIHGLLRIDQATRVTPPPPAQIRRVVASDVQTTDPGVPRSRGVGALDWFTVAVACSAGCIIESSHLATVITIQLSNMTVS